MMMTTIGFSFNSLSARSLGVQPHSHVYKPNMEAASSMVARFSDVSSGFGMAWTLFMVEEAMDSIWLGSFHVDKIKTSDVIKVDLNLRL